MDKNEKEDLFSQKFGLENQQNDQNNKKVEIESVQEQKERRNKIMKHIRDSNHFNESYQKSFYMEQTNQDKEFIIDLLGDNKEINKIIQENPEFLNRNQINFLNSIYMQRINQERSIMKHGIVKSTILRGKLGIDNLFIGFGLLGIFLIPSYFYFKQKKYKKKLDKFRQQQLKGFNNKEPDLDDLSYDVSFIDQEKYDKQILKKAKFEDKLRRLEYKTNENGIEYPISREGHSLNYYESQNILILFGGMNSIKNNDLYFFSIKNNYWSKQETTGIQPQPRCYHKSFIFKNYFFVIAGQSQHNKTLDDISILNLDNLIWKRIAIQKLPLSRSQFGLTFIQDTQDIYIFGGLNLPSNQFLNDLWKIDIKNLQFQNKSNELIGSECYQIQQQGDIPIARKGFFFQHHKKFLYAYGGICMDPTVCTDQIFQFDIENKIWNKIRMVQNNIQSRNNFSSCQIYDNIFLIYGGIDNVQKNNYKNLLALNLQNFTITEPFVAGQSPGPSNGHALCINQKKQVMYFIGGVDGQIKGMDIYSLNVYDQKNKSIEWNQKIRKNKFEQKVEEQGLDYLFEVNKSNNQLRDQILIETQKKIKLQQNLVDSKQKYIKFKEEQQQEINILKQKYKKKQQDKEEQFQIIEKNLLILKQIDYQYDFEEEKINLFQQNFQKIYVYTQMLDKILNKILQSKLKRLRQKIQIQIIDQNYQRTQLKNKILKKIILRLFNIIQTIF